MRRNLRDGLSRRGLFGLTLTAAAAAALPACGQDTAQQQTGGAAPAGGTAAGPWLGEKVYGKADAPITLIEYASLACSACATFHVNVFPKLKADFIDTGQVRMVFRDFPLNLPGLRAHQLARCGGERRFPGLVDVLFKTQNSWISATPEAALRKVAATAGISAQQFDACMADKELEGFLIQSQATGGSKHGVNSTPTFIVENTGERITGVDEAALFRALEKAGAKRGKAP